MLIAPSSMTVQSRRTQMGKDYYGNIVPFVMVYCCHCHCEGPWFQESALDADGGYVSYLCEPCAERFPDLLSVAMIPDQVFQDKVAQVIIEHEGRMLTPREIADKLSDSTSYLSKLVKDRPKGGQQCPR